MMQVRIAIHSGACSISVNGAQVNAAVVTAVADNPGRA